MEIGCGDGRILAECAAINPQLSQTGIDLRQKNNQWQTHRARWDGETWIGDDFLVAEPVLLVAIEWLDDVPATVATVNPAGQPVALGPTGDTAALSPADQRWLARWWPGLAPWERAVIGRSRDRAWQWFAQRLAPGSLLVSIDYGHTAARRPSDGGLTAHAAGAQVIPGVGVNVTAGVAIDSLATTVEATGAQRLWRERLRNLPDGFWPHPDGVLARLAHRSQEALLRAPHRFGDFWLVAHRL